MLRYSLSTAVLIPSTLLSAWHLKSQTHFTQCEEKKNSQLNERISVYLKPESKKLFENFLAKKGYKNYHVDFVSLHRNANTDISYIFKPLYGQRLAFRLKGLIELDNGTCAGFGRLSSMVGEVKDDEVEVSFPILPKGKTFTDEEIETLLDLPTRLRDNKISLENKTFWKGRISSSQVLGKHYPAIKASVILFPFSEQAIGDGHLCSHLHFDHKEYKCTYDISLEVEKELPISDKSSNTSSVSSEVTSSKQIEEESLPEPGQAPECPICRYLKAGPCKEEFIKWDDCVKSITNEEQLSQCAPITKSFFTCMKKYEYYDIMSAGIDPSRFNNLVN
ncbi:hypothetical protein M1146_07230, partial [Patescibacteria group bacterium]|nr:hypothetical protein [Patescibacteria group bacterium]